MASVCSLQRRAYGMIAAEHLLLRADVPPAKQCVLPDTSPCLPMCHCLLLTYKMRVLCMFARFRAGYNAASSSNLICCHVTQSNDKRGVGEAGICRDDQAVHSAKKTLAQACATEQSHTRLLNRDHSFQLEG